MTFLKTKDIQDLTELSKDEIYQLISLALKLKEEGKNSVRKDLHGRTVGLIFSKPSTRTRVSFEAGVSQLGGTPIYLQSSDMQMNRGESLEDTAKVLSSYLDAIVLRTYDHNDSLELAKYADIPIINALTDLHHPCQALADLMTIYEVKQHFSGLKMAYFGDGNNVCNSLIIACAKMGIDLAVATPKGFEPNDDVIARRPKADAAISKLDISNDPQQAAQNADVFYTDVWVSMGQEEEENERLNVFKPYQVNEKLLAKANSGAIVMHCLPAHRGQEITAEVMDSAQSTIFEQAKNRLYAQKALLIGLLGDEK